MNIQNMFIIIVALVVFIGGIILIAIYAPKTTGKQGASIISTKSSYLPSSAQNH